ncbi:hypothetical protein GUJ93_ZPchr0002g24453 [Zizania palustris]|uniref:Uncharacterized protein n=1 Tax=Zizania palustris TaxID=103762 RepID=A0A8J5VWJ5_ZIZPA|nr:hypothetical protein GUJ93_ZPchr0002g24453 [Zizania palustris]
MAPSTASISTSPLSRLLLSLPKTTAQPSSCSSSHPPPSQNDGTMAAKNNSSISVILHRCDAMTVVLFVAILSRLEAAGGGQERHRGVDLGCGAAQYEREAATSD